MQKLSVVSYNIHKGFTAANRRFVLRKMREAIRSVHADVVLLQEVMGAQKRLPGVAKATSNETPFTQSQFEFLADSIWSHHAYGRNAVTSRGHHGNVILSKYPIQSASNTDLSTNRFEKRGILHATIKLDSSKKRPPVHIFCVHLNLLERSRAKQLEKICKVIERKVPKNQPLILAGDFNDWRERATEILAKRLGLREAFVALHKTHATTFPSWMPMIKLDRIYYRGLKPLAAVCLTGPPWNELSDHNALFSEFEYE